MARSWAGMDIGKEHHHCVVIDAEGSRLLSRRVPNDETAPLALVSDVLAISEEVLWAVDLNHGGASLLIALLAGEEQPAAYLTGLAVDRASGTYRGEAKTDARDASVIADQAPMRRDLGAGRDGQPGPAEVLRGDRRTADRPAGRGDGACWQARGQRGGEAAGVQGHGHAEGAAEQPGRAVDRRHDAAFLRRHRAHDGLGGRRLGHSASRCRRSPSARR